MRKHIRKLRRRRLREKRVHLIREAHRLSRLDVFYNPNKPLQKTHTFKINRKFEGTEPIRGKRVITFPNSLNFDSSMEGTVQFLKELREELLYGEYGEIFLDQRLLNDISPEAAVVLLAELTRCMAYTSRRKKIQGNYPGSADATKMLSDIGFYTALNVKSPPQEKRKGSRIYIKAISDNQTDGRIINYIISNFEKAVTFDLVAKKRLYAGLTECMDNVRAHAYTEDPLRPDLFEEWWMAGFYDLATGQVAFVFYDQGVGIPTTLKTKFEHKLKSIFAWGDSDLIQHAVETGITKESSLRHGSGLPALKGFINELSPGGFLRVVSNSGDYTYFRNTKPTIGKPVVPLDGSLIIWSIQPNKESVNTLGTGKTIIDLTSKQERLPI